MRILSLFLLLFSFTSFAQTYSGDSWASVKSKGIGTLACVYYPTPGLVYEESGQVKGLCVDILNDFKAYVKNNYDKTVNIKFVGKETVWTDFLNNTLNGKNTVGVANITITQERKKQMKFSPPFMENPLVFITSNSAPDLASADEIDSKMTGYTALTITGSTHEKIMKYLKEKYFPSLKITYTSSGQEVLSQMRTNTELFTILDFTEYFDAVRKKEPIKRQDIELGAPKEEFGFVMPISSDWQPLWTEFLSPEYRQSVAYRKIVASNLGTAFLGMMTR